ncbi:MAG: hypothetical protein AB8B56_15610 [Crocinitomicaceae bacterium]
MKQLLVITLAIFSLSACTKKELGSNIASYGLKAYMDSKAYLPTGNVIAFAGGNPSSFMGDADNPISVFFYAEEGASNFQYFETNSINVDPNDYNQYFPKDYDMTVLYKGFMRKFDHPSIANERWGIVTYETDGTVHVCDPIRIKAVVAPTEDVSPGVTIIESGVNPEFDWFFVNEPQSETYLSIVSDMENNLVSAVYTNDKFWTFYSISNVVLNLTPGSEAPSLIPDSEYNYTMFGISEDNWVHTITLRSFETD